MDFSLLTIVEWLGSVLGVMGAILVALNIKQSGYGFILFLVSSLLFIWFGLSVQAYGLVFMQVAFAIINVLGIYRWLIFKPV